MKTSKSILFISTLMVGGFAVHTTSSAQNYYTNYARKCTDPYPVNPQEWLEFNNFVINLQFAFL